jgi:hypothetical protein
MRRPERKLRQRVRGYRQSSRAEHRVIAVGHHEQPSYPRRLLRMLTRLFR